MNRTSQNPCCLIVRSPFKHPRTSAVNAPPPRRLNALVNMEYLVACRRRQVQLARARVYCLLFAVCFACTLAQGQSPAYVFTTPLRAPFGWIQIHCFHMYTSSLCITGIRPGTVCHFAASACSRVFLYVHVSWDACYPQKRGEGGARISGRQYVRRSSKDGQAQVSIAIRTETDSPFGVASLTRAHGATALRHILILTLKP